MLPVFDVCLGFHLVLNVVRQCRKEVDTRNTLHLVDRVVVQILLLVTLRIPDDKSKSLGLAQGTPRPHGSCSYVSEPRPYAPLSTAMPPSSDNVSVCCTMPRKPCAAGRFPVFSSVVPPYTSLRPSQACQSTPRRLAALSTTPAVSLSPATPDAAPPCARTHGRQSLSAAALPPIHTIYDVFSFSLPVWRQDDILTISGSYF